MSHEIEFRNDKAAMAFAGEVPWHGLGVKVPPDLSPEQMLRTADLDWEVVKHPLYYTVKEKDKNKKVDSEHDALVRADDNKQLDVVTRNWKPVQNKEAFDFFTEFVEAGDMEMHTAGSLMEGQIIWALAKIKESFELFKGDRIDSYLLFTNPHRFGQSIDVRFTPIRVVCNNTLTMALEGSRKDVVKLNHRVKFDPVKAKQLLGITSTTLGNYKRTAEFLGAKQYTDKLLKKYFTEVFPVIQLDKSKETKKEISKNAELALETVEIQPGARFAKGSWWQAFNTVTFLTDHILGRSSNNRLASAWYGPNKNLKNKALNLAVDYAKGKKELVTV